jgi:hypothetical protein
MPIIYIGAALYGAAITFLAVSPLGTLPALAAAPFGGSAVVLAVALLLYRDPSSWQRSPRPEAQQRPPLLNPIPSPV